MGGALAKPITLLNVLRPFAKVSIAIRDIACPILGLGRVTHKTRRATRPLFPQKLTFYSAIGMSALCQQRKSAALFDDLVREL